MTLLVYLLCRPTCGRCLDACLAKKVKSLPLLGFDIWDGLIPRAGCRMSSTPFSTLHPRSDNPDHLQISRDLVCAHMCLGTLSHSIQLRLGCFLGSQFPIIGLSEEREGSSPPISS